MRAICTLSPCVMVQRLERMQNKNTDKNTVSYRYRYRYDVAIAYSRAYLKMSSILV